jgi:hypothetical protein
MKRFALALVLLAASTPSRAADVGVSITVGQPGFYGRLDIGGYPPPVFLYPQPVIIVPAPAGVVYAPLYLHVPPGHAKHWKRYCGHYGACGRPVYFVQDRWYNDVYVPHYRERHAHGEGNHGHHDKGHGHGHEGD